MQDCERALPEKSRIAMRARPLPFLTLGYTVQQVSLPLTRETRAKRHTKQKKTDLLLTSWSRHICLRTASSFAPKTAVKLDKLPEYLRDTVDWFMG